jgi:hypothetical protein
VQLRLVTVTLSDVYFTTFCSSTAAGKRHCADGDGILSPINEVKDGSTLQLSPATRPGQGRSSSGLPPPTVSHWARVTWPLEIFSAARVLAQHIIHFSCFRHPVTRGGLKLMRSKDDTRRLINSYAANYSPLRSSHSEFNPAIFIIYLKKLVGIKIF